MPADSAITSWADRQRRRVQTALAGARPAVLARSIRAMCRGDVPAWNVLGFESFSEFVADEEGLSFPNPSAFRELVIHSGGMSPREYDLLTVILPRQAALMLNAAVEAADVELLTNEAVGLLEDTGGDDLTANALEDARERVLSALAENNCGTGSGGFQEGNTCASGGDGGGAYTPGSGEGRLYVTRPKAGESSHETKAIARATRARDDAHFGLSYTEGEQALKDAAELIEPALADRAALARDIVRANTKASEDVEVRYKDRTGVVSIDVGTHALSVELLLEPGRGGTVVRSDRRKAVIPHDATDEQAAAIIYRVAGYKLPEGLVGGLVTGNNCGTGAGGFQPGNTCAAGGKTYGKSKAKTEYAPAAKKSQVDKVLKATLGKADLETVASVVGAPDEATVTVDAVNAGRAVVTIDHPDFEAKRYITRDGRGRLYVENSEFWVKPSAQGKGLGTEVFARQVEQARQAGVAYIKCHAAKQNPNDRSKPHNGYYTWPRLGYDQELDDPDGVHYSDEGDYKKARQAFPQAQTVLDIMSTPEGRAWWKTNGRDMLNARFDLSDGSRSMRILEAYLDERSKRTPAANRRWQPAPRGDRPEPGGGGGPGGGLAEARRGAAGVSLNAGEGGNCGTGAGGFKEGNTCAGGGGGSDAEDAHLEAGSRQDAEDDAIDRQRAIEDKEYIKAHNTLRAEEERLGRMRGRQDAATDRAREKQLSALEAKKDADTDAAEEAHDREEIAEEQRQARLKAAYDAYSREYDKLHERWQAEDAAKAEARKQEDAVYDARRDQLERDEEERTAHREEEDARREARDREWFRRLAEIRAGVQNFDPNQPRDARGRWEKRGAPGAASPGGETSLADWEARYAQRPSFSDFSAESIDPGDDFSAPPRTHEERLAAVEKTMADALKRAGLPRETERKYAQSVSQVLRAMPEGMARELHANLKQVTFLATTREVSAAYEAETGRKLGAVVGFANVNSGRVTLDGGPGGSRAWNGRAGVCAHELTHVVDKGFGHSSSPGWQAAWREEVARARRPPSSHSQVNPREGFAEFGRLVAFDRELAKARFPKCWAYWEAAGLT